MMTAANSQAQSEVPALVVLCVTRDDDLRRRIESACRAMRDLAVTLAFEADLKTAGRLISRTRFDALILAEDSLPDVAGGSRSTLRELAAFVPVIAIGSGTDAFRARDAMHGGARDFLTADDLTPQSVGRALKCVTGPASSARRNGHAKLIAFVGAKGGVGTTTVLLNTAIVLARQGFSVVAAEVTPWAGGFAAHLRQEPSATLVDLLAEPAQIERVIERFLIPLPPSVRLLFGGTVPGTATPLEASTFDRIVRALSIAPDYTLFDLPASLPASLERGVRHLDHVVMVTEPHATGRACARAVRDRLHAWGVGDARLSLLVVGHDPESRDAVAAASIADDLGLKLIGSIPAAAEACRLASRRGVPYVVSAPDNPASEAVGMATKELQNQISIRRLKVALVTTSAEMARHVTDLFVDADAVRCDVMHVAQVDDMLADLASGVYDAALIDVDGSADEASMRLARTLALADRTAVVALMSSGDDRRRDLAFSQGAQDVLTLARLDPYWLLHAVQAGVKRRQLVHDLEMRNRELKECEVSQRRMVAQLLRNSRHDPRMV